MAADAKKAHLNGAYYGPPVPPRDTYRSVGRSSSACCCGPCCILSTVFKLILSAAVAAGAILLVIWLVFRPNKLHVYVESATLTRFNLTGAQNALDYDLALDVSIRNPNRRVGIYYDRVEARAIYDGSRFGYDGGLPAFYQGHKNTTVLRPRFRGSAGAFWSVSGAYNREKGEGGFYVDVRIYASVRLKVKFVKVGHFKPRFDCTVKLPAPSSGKGNGSGSFERTKCGVDLF